MASTVQTLAKLQLIQPPSWLATNVHYETMMGSIAYGVSDDSSDVDIYGFCIPPKDVVFPHLAGKIPGFGKAYKRFDQFQQHHISHGDDEYDISIYNIVRYFQLCMENNPNMVDSLFTPERCVLHCSAIGVMVRERRKEFLHKGCWAKYKGYAHAQLHKMRGQKREGKRKVLFEKFGFDVKFAYHVVRLMYEAEMILVEGDLDLTRHRAHLKSIRRGESSQEDIFDWFESKEKALEKAYETSTLPWGPDEDKIKNLLLDCLEHHYGSLEKAIVKEDRILSAFREITDILNRVRVD